MAVRQIDLFSRCKCKGTTQVRCLCVNREPKTTHTHRKLITALLWNICAKKKKKKGHNEKQIMDRRENERTS